MQTHVICHCGKCKITCNKHGKKAKCDECGKRRMLGTKIKRNFISHICDECCEKSLSQPLEDDKGNNWDEWEEEIVK